MPTKSENVELRLAFAWTCPECGLDHFERAINAEMSPEELEELRSEHGVQPWETGHFSMSPKSVTCPECKQNFQTAEFDSVDDEADC